VSHRSHLSYIWSFCFPPGKRYALRYGGNNIYHPLWQNIVHSAHRACLCVLSVILAVMRGNFSDLLSFLWRHCVFYKMRPELWELKFSQQWLWRMVSSGKLRRVALVRTSVSEEFSASFIRVTRIGELGITLAVTSNRCRLRRNKWGAKFLRNVGSFKSHTA
jgi:hypothetical protein